MIYLTARNLLILCLSVLPLSFSIAQQHNGDTAFVGESIALAVSKYSASIRTHGHLYNGSQYFDYYPTDDEHPFFLTSDWSEGAINYDGEYYDNVSLMYDIYTDKVVVESYTGSMIQLVSEKILSFSYGGHTFKRLYKSDDSRQEISDGFYDILHEGSVDLVVRRSKWFSETVEATKIIRQFDQRQSYYLVKNNTFYPVKSKKSFLQVLGDKRTELKQFIQSNKIKFKPNREQAMIKVAAYYDTLNP
jgi:hypothetical protein